MHPRSRKNSCCPSVAPPFSPPSQRPPPPLFQAPVTPFSPGRKEGRKERIRFTTNWAGHRERKENKCNCVVNTTAKFFLCRSMRQERKVFSPRVSGRIKTLLFPPNSTLLLRMHGRPPSAGERCSFESKFYCPPSRAQGKVSPIICTTRTKQK